MLLILVLLGFFTVQGLAQCPSNTGFYPDAHQCDKYIQCTDGIAVEKLCPDGFVFSVTSPLYERCDYPYRVDCRGREALQEPKTSGNCLRQNGLFANRQGTCGQFWSCEKGKGVLQNCPEGLVFNEVGGGCEWPDVTQRCDAEGFLGFKCPPLDEQIDQDFEHPRYPHPNDCRKLFICLHGRSPRLLQCPPQKVYNSRTYVCDDPINVPGCESYYPPDLTLELNRLPPN